MQDAQAFQKFTAVIRLACGLTPIQGSSIPWLRCDDQDSFSGFHDQWPPMTYVVENFPPPPPPAAPTCFLQFVCHLRAHALAPGCHMPIAAACAACMGTHLLYIPRLITTSSYTLLGEQTWQSLLCCGLDHRQAPRLTIPCERRPQKMLNSVCCCRCLCSLHRR